MQDMLQHMQKQLKATAKSNPNIFLSSQVELEASKRDSVVNV